MAKLRCPVCGGHEVDQALVRDRLPVMQNVVYPTREAARTAECARFSLSVCSRCGFAFNDAFDASLLRYDASYDNDVPSPRFTRYYEEIARHLVERHRLGDGATVFDVGCGKGTFLEVLARLAPGVRAVGVDPSASPRREENFELIADVFRGEIIGTRPALVICRHVLEHMPDPVGFVNGIGEPLASWQRVPVFFEVPDLGWILKNDAFWDFCYEHCNYFSASALRYALTRAGVRVLDQTDAFDGQYQWAEGVVDGRSAELESLGHDAGRDAMSVLSYARRESERIRDSAEAVRAAAAAGNAVIWGMATKGVVFANLIDQEARSIVAGVDMNPKKQGHFIPGTGHAIHAPAWLATLRGPVTIFVMNPNYAEEIRELCGELGVDARFAVP